MTNFPQFTADENLNRVIMDKNTPYLIVEGAYDLPIYCEVISLLVDKHQLKAEPTIVFGGGKLNIMTWVDKETPSNAAIVLDMDFDNLNTELNKDVVFPLRRYSIENYFFEEDVAAPFIAHLLKRNPKDICDNLTFDELKTNWGEELDELIPVIFYYQKVYLGDKSKWSTCFINRGQGDWRLCTDKINSLKEQLLDEMNVSYDICESQFKINMGAAWSPQVNFPGKILFESFHRYLKDICNKEVNGVYGGAASNYKSLVTHLSSRLIKNTELEDILLEAIN